MCLHTKRTSANPFLLVCVCVALLLRCISRDSCALIFTTRRATLTGSLALGVPASTGLPASAADTLASRLDSRDLTPFVASPFADQELYYPDWMFGSWSVLNSEARIGYPLGEDKAPKSFSQGLLQHCGEQGTTVQVQARYYSTIANNAENQAILALGLGVPKSKIIADRAFNAIQANRVCVLAPQITTVDWDPSVDLTSLTAYFSGAAFLRQETRFTARIFELTEGDRPIFRAAEQLRVSTIGAVESSESNVEIITEYKLETDGLIKGRSRTAVYPSSQDAALWLQVGGKATVFVDRTFTMERQVQTLPDGSVRPCVDTFKGFTQCVGGLVFPTDPSNED